MDYYVSPIAYGAIVNDENIRCNSRSGGVFTAISDYILDDGGIVYGAKLDEDFSVIHARADDKEGRNQFRGSKYVQSSMGNSYKNVKNDLEDGRSVLFSGTSCQIQGLINFLGKDYEKLITVDILCHGVPSPIVWKEYLKWQERVNNSKIVKVDFRNKKDFGWEKHIETCFFEDGSHYNSRVYTNLFYNHNILRPCCYECNFKTYIHPGDITLGDFWEIKKIDPEFNDDKGVSLVLINDSRGKKIFDEIKCKLIYREYDYVKTFRKSMLMSYPKPVTRERFWDEFNNKGFEYVAFKEYLR